MASPVQLRISPHVVMSNDSFDHHVDTKDQWQGRGKRLVRKVTKTLCKRSVVSNGSPFFDTKTWERSSVVMDCMQAGDALPLVPETR